MAALTVASVCYGVDQSVTFTFTTVNDGDTFALGTGKTSIQYSMTGNPTTQASAGTSFSYAASTGVLTVYPGEDGLGGMVRAFPVG